MATGMEIVSFVSSVGSIEMSHQQIVELTNTVTREQVDQDILRCPHPEMAEKMKAVRARRAMSSMDLSPSLPLSPSPSLPFHRILATSSPSSSVDHH